MKKLTIQARIEAAFVSGIDYRNLAHKVFPIEEYPRSWRYKSGGGPPGCFMALTAALRRLGYITITHERSGRRLVYKKDT